MTTASTTKDAYINIYIHFIDENFEIANFLLDQEELQPPHDGKIIANKLDDVFQRYEIAVKIKTISTDNGSNMVKAIKRLKSYYLKEYGVQILHIRCGNHILHLIVNDFLKTPIVIFFNYSFFYRETLQVHELNLVN